MKARAIVLVLALCLVGAAVSYGTEDAFMGTWKRNESTSKTSANSPKNTTVVYEVAGDSVKITMDGVGAEGKPTHNEWTGKFDGTDYPVTGDAGYDTRAYKRINAHTLAFTDKKDGKVTETGHIVVSPDGKSRTVTTHGTDAKGMKVTRTIVYDKE